MGNVRKSDTFLFNYKSLLFILKNLCVIIRPKIWEECMKKYEKLLLPQQIIFWKKKNITLTEFVTN